jgi:hypothetical protein
MKHEIKNTTSKEKSNNREQKVIVNKNHLYNLLFAGRISLKEYLQKINEEELQHQAA